MLKIVLNSRRQEVEKKSTRVVVEPLISLPSLPLVCVAQYFSMEEVSALTYVCRVFFFTKMQVVNFSYIHVKFLMSHKEFYEQLTVPSVYGARKSRRLVIPTVDVGCDISIPMLNAISLPYVSVKYFRVSKNQNLSNTCTFFFIFHFFL